MTKAVEAVAVGVVAGLLTASPGFGAACACGVIMGTRDRGKDRRQKPAHEFMAELERDADWVAARQRERLEQQRKRAEWAAAEVPLVSELRGVGVHVTTAWDLVNTSDPYREAIPILVRHVERAYPDRVKEGIARALAVPEARPYWHTLRRLFEETQAGTDAKDGLAVALSASCDEGVLLDIVGLLRQPRHGDSRLLLLLALERSQAPAVSSVLEELAQDPALAQEIARIRRRRKKRAADGLG